MTLTLRALSLNDRPLTRPITAHFDVQGGSVGRADHNTLALPDPERHISRQQAEISVISGAYRIKNVGSANPIIVCGQPVARGETVPISHLDQVRIGGYLLEVIEEEANDGEASTVVRGRATVGAGMPGTNPGMTPGSMPVAPSAPLSRGNPFADLLGDATPTPMPVPVPVPVPVPRQPGAMPLTPRAADRPAAPAPPLIDAFFNPRPAAAGVPAESAAWESARSDPVRALLPDDFDPFAAPTPAAPPSRAESSPGTGQFDDLIPSAAPASIDQLFDLQPGQRDPLADFMADVSPASRVGAAGQDPEPRAAPLSTDPMALFRNLADAFPSVDHQPAPDRDAQELHASFVPPTARSPTPVATPARPTPPASPAPPPTAAPAPAAAPTDWHGDPRELWSAFCDGAGVSVELPQGLQPELMRVVGSLLQAAVAGTLQLMVVRATARHELRAQVTMIQARNNNPLKFSPDARSALEQMLQPPMRGFLGGPEAMTDAMHDLMGHTIGTMAGTRAALEGVLDRFTPQQLEAKLVGKSMLDNLLPMNRKAKLWELYLHHYETLRNEAQDDFHTLFGRAFLAAYEQQLDRLHRSKADDAGEPGHA